jgi:16S rRNA (adenine1518-N6/adenine1519-N6)-dimethyltransferase
MPMQQESLLTQTRKLLKLHGIRARKSLAQHFLVDGAVLKKILDAAELSSSDTVVEVGPGLGVLTRELVKAAGRVIAIELDATLAELVKANLSAPNLTVITGDVLKTDPASVVGETRRYNVVANLPYYITSAVTRHFLEASLKPDIMVLMVQKEVAAQITAEPGEMSLLSVSVQFYGKPRVFTRVPARAFYPAPNVDSAVLRIDVYPRPAVAADDIAAFFALVRAGFSANRKQLANSLSHGLGAAKSEVLPLLEKASIDPTRRAETLTMGEWRKLFDAYKATGRCVWSQ